MPSGEFADECSQHRNAESNAPEEIDIIGFCIGLIE
jgi:hypothetical protein